uniref:hypothetical protein n=1 Tax=Nocardioides sp. R-C-SC26 TaxID=2870414 RepID=UPI001E341662
VDDEPSPAGASTPGASDSAITDNPSDPSESPTETAGDFDDVEPATGPALRLPGISLRLPAGWEYSRTRTEFFVSGGYGASSISISQLPSLGLGTSLDDLAETTLDVGSMAGGRRLDDVVVDGVPMIHVVVREDSERVRHVFAGYGGSDGNDDVTVTVSLTPNLRAQTEEIIGSAMASVIWRGRSVAE